MPLQLHDRDHRRRRRRRSGLSILRASLLAGYTMTSFRSSATSTPLRRMRAVAQFRHPLHWGVHAPSGSPERALTKRDSHLADEGDSAKIHSVVCPMAAWTKIVQLDFVRQTRGEGSHGDGDGGLGRRRTSRPLWIGMRPARVARSR